LALVRVGENLKDLFGSRFDFNAPAVLGFVSTYHPKTERGDQCEHQSVRKESGNNAHGAAFIKMLQLPSFLVVPRLKPSGE
jgi:hypothetical protein